MLLPKYLKLLGKEVSSQKPSTICTVAFKSKLCHVQSSVEIPFHLYQASPEGEPEKAALPPIIVGTPGHLLLLSFPANWTMKESR